MSTPTETVEYYLECLAQLLKPKPQNPPAPTTPAVTNPPAAAAAAAAEQPAECNALDVGHRSCKCGGPQCGENAAVPSKIVRAE
jgi:hypothetical protein